MAKSKTSPSGVVRTRRDDGKGHVDVPRTIEKGVVNGLSGLGHLLVHGSMPKASSPLTKVVQSGGKLTGKGGPGYIPPKHDAKTTAALKAGEANAINGLPKSLRPTVTAELNTHDKVVAKATGTKPPVASSDRAASDVKQVQTILRNHGYNVTVDGIEGPQTESALADFHSSGGDSKKWNTSQTHTGSPAATTTTSTNGGGGGGTSDANSTGGYGGGSGGTKPGPTTPSADDVMAQVQKAIADGKASDINPAKYMVDPKAYARSSANEQYNPQITQANRLITDARGQSKTNQLDLSKWFGAASALAKTGSVQAHTMEMADQKANSTGNANILAAFGGNAGAGGHAIAQQGLANTKFLGGEAANNDAFNGMLQGMLGQQGASAKTQQLQMDNKSIGDMKSALTALIGAKAADMTKTQQDARTTNLQSMLGIKSANNASDANTLNQAITLGLLPTQIAQAGANVDATVADTTYKNAAAKSAADSAYYKGYLTQAQIDKYEAQTKALQQKGLAPKYAFNNSTATDISNAKATALGAITLAKKSNPDLTARQAAAIGAAAVPWSVGTPGVAAQVLLPSIRLAGYSGAGMGIFSGG